MYTGDSTVGCDGGTFSHHCDGLVCPDLISDSGRERGAVRYAHANAPGHIGLQSFIWLYGRADARRSASIE
jgi:hypothetical protein